MELEDVGEVPEELSHLEKRELEALIQINDKIKKRLEKMAEADIEPPQVVELTVEG